MSGDPRAELRAFECVANTYCVNEKDARYGYDRRWKLRVLWSDGTTSDFNGRDEDGSEGVYRQAIAAARNRLPSWNVRLSTGTDDPPSPFPETFDLRLVPPPVWFNRLDGPQLDEIRLELAIQSIEVLDPEATRPPMDEMPRIASDEIWKGAARLPMSDGLVDDAGPLMPMEERLAAGRDYVEPRPAWWRRALRWLADL